MSVDRWNSVLVLGGIRSGKSAYAEALVADAPSVRYVATAVGAEDDPEWMNRIEAHQRRRPQSWSTEETGPDPSRLAALLAEAKPDETLLVDDLGGWVTALLDPANQPQNDVAMVEALAVAVRECAARVVVVSPEVGLSLVPMTPVGRAFADAVGTVNQALAEVSDRVFLVVAGRPTELTAAAQKVAVEKKQPTPVVEPEPTPVMESEPTPVVEPQPTPVADVLAQATQVLPLVASGVEITQGMDLPLPDPDAGRDARDRLATVDLPGLGLGSLTEAIEFAAATQGTTLPRAWSSPRVLLIAGTHGGGAAAGADPDDAERRVAQVENGEGVLARLAGTAGADVAVVRTAASGAMEDGPVLDAAAVDAALRRGWRLADEAGEAGRDVLILASAGTGLEAAATAVLAATTGAEPVAMLPRVLQPGGTYDDNAWMERCAAVRDALHRIRQEPRGAEDMLAEIGGADVAVAAGVLIGAAARRLPVLIDGPLGIAAGLIARDLASQVRHWSLLPDKGTHALVRQGADVLGLTPVTELGLDLGEGANALAALPLLKAAIGLASALPLHPALLQAQDDAEFAEPEGAGPGPATNDYY